MGTNYPRAGYRRQTITVTANYFAVDGDVIEADASGGAFTIWLPSSDLNANAEVTVKKMDNSANEVTVATLNSQTIDGESVKVIKRKYNAPKFKGNNSNWIME